MYNTISTPFSCASLLWMVMLVNITSCCGDTEPAHENAEEEEVEAATSKHDLGFRPKHDGFGFENYGNDGIKNLTAAEVEYLFGEEACAARSEDTCILTPAGRQWLEQTNAAMNGGHCEGMAVLSLLLYSGELELSNFGDVDATSELDLKRNPLLQRELALWFATQATSPTVDSELRDLTPKAIVAKLQQGFKAGVDGPLYSLGIYKEDMSGGHAVTPFAVRKAGKNSVNIVIYDNNHPGIERTIHVDLKKNVWRYQASTNPDEPESEYVGDASTKTMTLTPMEPRLAKQDCPFCGEEIGFEDDDELRLKGHKSKFADIWLDGAADLLLVDDKGRRLGMSNGKLINEIPGARALAYRSELWNDDQEPVYRVPIGIPLTITLDGSRLKEPEESEVTLIAPAYTLEVDGIVLDPGQQDTIEISKDLRTLSYATEGMETPELLIGITRPGADYEFIVSAGGDSDGHSVVLDLDLKNSALAIGIEGRENTEFDIEMARIDDDGEDVFEHSDSTVGENAIFYIDFGTWKGDGTPMTVRIDEDNDGDIDTTDVMEDRQE